MAKIRRNRAICLVGYTVRKGEDCDKEEASRRETTGVQQYDRVAAQNDLVQTCRSPGSGPRVEATWNLAVWDGEYPDPRLAGGRGEG